MHKIRAFSCIWLLVLAISGSHGADSSKKPGDVIDLAVALRVGTRETSGFLVDKYYNRYAEGERRQKQRALAPEESRNWLKRFVAQQIIMAHAESLGYFTRPEVRATVARMERHMLTQAAGPYYQRLLESAPPLSETELKAIYEKRAQVFDCMIVRFGGEPTLPALGEDFERIPLNEQTRRILHCAEREGLQMMDGTFSWPFAPFMEIADIPGAVQPGRWIKHHDPSRGIYYVLIRNLKTQPIGDYSSNRLGFQMFIKRMNPMILQRRRHCELIMSSSLSLCRPTADRFLEFCRNLPPNTGTIPQSDNGHLASEPLFLFKLDGNKITISVDAFCRNFNDQFTRRIPLDLPSLRQDTEGMAVEEMDFRAAQALGIDQTAKFVEERRGFEGFQVLDLFEKEVLIPKIEINRSDIDRYFQEHAADFRSVTKIHGRFLRFDTLEKAAAWRKGASVAPTTDEKLDLGAEKPIAGLEYLQQQFMKMPEGATMGPIKYDQSGIIFIKLKNVEEGLPPIETVRDKIREVLTRQALDEKELQLAAELSTHLKIENHLDYARYGVSTKEVEKSLPQ
ncbi:MAG: peptidylprolyl isomerase [Opitutaceae bacterium]|jgi:hypothetical protein